MLLKDMIKNKANWKIGRVVNPIVGKDGVTRGYKLLLAMGTWSKDLFSYCRIWKSVEQVMIPGRQLKTLNTAVMSLKPEQINADRSDQNEKQGAQP